jgi:NAD(P)-dependent dehydrogenase (short-subunit alcohol dehydrogenase family)
VRLGAKNFDNVGDRWVVKQPHAIFTGLDILSAGSTVMNERSIFGQPPDIAPAVIFLASDESAWITVTPSAGGAK